MKALLRLAVRFYPRAWRDRYGEEFHALIDDIRPHWHDILNVVAAALVTRMSTAPAIALAGALAVAGALTGALVSLTTPAVYASTSQVVVREPDATGTDVERAQRLRAAIQAVLEESALDKRTVAVTLRQPAGEQTVLDVAVSADSAAQAKQRAETAVNSLMVANLTAAERAGGSPRQGMQFRVLAAPQLPTDGSHPTERLSLIGGALGLFAGSLIVLTKGRRKNKTA
jgi:hypothetical protein